MNASNTDQLREMITESDKNSFENRLIRFRFLLEVLGEGYVPFPSIVLQYFEETKLCFYSGAFVASILMASATIEEILRQIYRDRTEMEKANARGLAEIIDCALEDELISSDEAAQLNELRKLRNKFTHIYIGYKDTDLKKNKSYLDFHLLWGDPRRDRLPLEELAEDAIKIFARFAPELCLRFWG